MDLKTLTAQNDATTTILRQTAGQVPIDHHAFHGYFEVDLFECPPFLMFTNNDCPRSWNILFDKYFEPQSMRIWCRLARVATGVLDIGAHVGVYSLSAAALRKDISIHAVEPNPHAYARLRINKMVNGFQHIVEHHFAVGNETKYVKLSWDRKPTLHISSGAAILKRKGEDVEHATVLMMKLDGTGLAATLGAKPVIKIDVEGAEAAAMLGMREILQLKPDIILETFSPGSCDIINAMLMPLGYRTFLVEEKAGRMTARDSLQPSDRRGEDFNQFLTTRGDDELRALGLI